MVIQSEHTQHAQRDSRWAPRAPRDTVGMEYGVLYTSVRDVHQMSCDDGLGVFEASDQGKDGDGEDEGLEARQIRGVVEEREERGLSDLVAVRHQHLHPDKVPFFVYLSAASLVNAASSAH